MSLQQKLQLHKGEKKEKEVSICVRSVQIKAQFCEKCLCCENKISNEQCCLSEVLGENACQYTCVKCVSLGVVLYVGFKSG